LYRIVVSQQQMLIDYILLIICNILYIFSIYKFVFITQFFLNISKIYELIMATNIALIAVFKYYKNLNIYIYLNIIIICKYYEKDVPMIYDDF